MGDGKESVSFRRSSESRLIFVTGGLCGSVFVDAAFEKYIKTLVGQDDYDSIKEKPKKRMMREFEMSVKRCFTGDNNKIFSVDLLGVDDNAKEGIVDDTISLKP